MVSLWTVLQRIKAQAAGTDDRATLRIVHEVIEHGPLRLTALAECAALDASTVSRHVSALEAAGHLARTGDPDDRRASRIAVTDSGRALLLEALAQRGRILEDAMAGWPPDERAALAGLMKRLAEDLA